MIRFFPRYCSFLWKMRPESSNSAVRCQNVGADSISPNASKNLHLGNEKEFPQLSNLSKEKKKPKIDMISKLEPKLEVMDAKISSMEPITPNKTTPFCQHADSYSPSSLPMKNSSMGTDLLQPLTQKETNSLNQKVILDIKQESKLFESSPAAYSTNQMDDQSLPPNFGKKNASYHKRKSNFHHDNQVVEPFDICCRTPIRSSMLDEESEQKWLEIPNSIEENNKQVLGPGMVLLKGYLTINEQAEIVKRCRELGLRSGGFYQPGYNDGAKLRLQMMCLGKNWDPQTKYKEKQRKDGSMPPCIPLEFTSIVKRSLEDSNSLIDHHFGANMENNIPSMNPDICIVNFYTTTGRLGLHQDRDESEESLRKGLPVVSFSVGDSAEFLYGDRRDVNKAKNVTLESGDVLIFGGKSRHFFHGVTSIFQRTAPPELLQKTMLRPGRLNLTFRQY